MRGFVIALLVCVPAMARADVALKGWTADGNAVIGINRGMNPWSAAWIDNALPEDDGYVWAVCKPAALGNVPENGGDDGCTVCHDAKSCGIATDASDAKSSLVSPDKKLKVKDKRKCAKGVCTRTIAFGKVGKLTYDEAWKGDKAPMYVYFRPDSGAAVVAFDATAENEGVMWSVMDVVSLATSTSYAFQLGKVTTHDSGEDKGHTEGKVKLSLAITSGGKTRKVVVDKLSLSSYTELGLGEPIAFDASLSPTLTVDGQPDADFGADLAAAVKSNLPTGTVQAFGVVDDGQPDVFQFEIYAIVKDAAGVRIVKQSWESDRTAPNDEKTLEVKL